MNGRRLVSSFLDALPGPIRICFSCRARSFWSCCSSRSLWRSHLMMNTSMKIRENVQRFLPFSLLFLFFKLLVSLKESLVHHVLYTCILTGVDWTGALDTPWCLLGKINKNTVYCKERLKKNKKKLIEFSILGSWYYYFFLTFPKNDKWRFTSLFFLMHSLLGTTSL